MMMKSKLLALPVVVGLAVSLIAAAPATADVDDTPVAAKRSFPVQEYLDDNPDVVVEPEFEGVESAVLIDEEADEVGLLGEPEVGEEEPVSELTAGRAAAPAASSCIFRNAAFLNLTGWQNSLDGCSIIGINTSSKYNYQWVQDVTAFNSGPSCVQGRGYYSSQSVSTPLWFNAGCGGGGSVKAHIGNRATKAKIRGHLQHAGTFGYVRWK